MLGALQQVALAYLAREGAALPFWQMATAPVDSLRARAEALGTGTVVECASVTGGGTVPGVEIPSAGIAIDGDVTSVLRAARPKPIIARVEEHQTMLDLRTVDPADDHLIPTALEALT